MQSEASHFLSEGSILYYYIQYPGKGQTLKPHQLSAVPRGPGTSGLKDPEEGNLEVDGTTLCLDSSDGYVIVWICQNLKNYTKKREFSSV